MYIHGAFSAISGASSVKIWHPPRTDREKGSEEGRRKPVKLEISPPSWIGQQYIILMIEQRAKTTCCLH
jgi:hypothetical protein